MFASAKASKLSWILIVNFTPFLSATGFSNATLSSAIFFRFTGCGFTFDFIHLISGPGEEILQEIGGRFHLCSQIVNQLLVSS